MLNLIFTLNRFHGITHINTVIIFITIILQCDLDVDTRSDVLFIDTQQLYLFNVYFTTTLPCEFCLMQSHIKLYYALLYVVFVQGVLNVQCFVTFQLQLVEIYDFLLELLSEEVRLTQDVLFYGQGGLEFFCKQSLVAESKLGGSCGVKNLVEGLVKYTVVNIEVFLTSFFYYCL